MKWFALHLCPHVTIFPSQIFFFQEVLPKLVETIKQLYVLQILTKSCFTTTSFDFGCQRTLWYICFCHFFGGKISNLAHYHRIIWSIWHIKASSSKKWQHCWINIYRLRKKIIAYVKDEGTNLSTMKPTTWNLLWVVKSYIRRMLMWNYWHIRVKDTCILMYCNEWLKWYKDLEVCIVSKFY